VFLGIIGGSGLYQLDEAQEGESLTVSTPFGNPSGKILRRSIGPNTLLFLPRHGEGHRLLPSEINYRANLYALKELGAQAVLSVSAVGSMKKEIPPGKFVLPDQYLDLTRGIRASSFFGGGVVGHAPFAEPACVALREHTFAATQREGLTSQFGGTYVCIEGPQFSTRAESHWIRSWILPHGGADVIGMTALPEAKLAREAGLCYQTIAMATDYDCWDESHESVTAGAVMKTMANNVEVSRRLIKSLASLPFPACRSHCREAMKNAIMTAEKLWPPERRKELEVILS
jgi:5'-methylthioadenosine phosphorylase